ELAELRRELADEEATFQGGMVGADDDEAVEEVDNDEGWVDEMDNLTDKEKEDLERSIRPVKLALVKLRKVAFKIVHSTTIVLPAWKEILNDLCLTISLMPRDVATRWNSTFDLLEYALKHRRAVDLLMQRRELGL
ncbi:hypothetical protein SCLCIDRAFT_69646, partial [Scleroderma citrinum Foug A]